MGARELSPNVRAALEGAVIDGCTVRFPTQLDRATFEGAAKVLGELGGRYRTGRANGYVFSADPTEGLARVLAGGPAAARTAEGYVRTPDAVADRLCRDYAEIQGLPAGARVLEPSAGDGSLVHAIHRANPDVHVFAVEPNADRVERMLSGQAGRLTLAVTTLEHFASPAYDADFDAVVMNPPWALLGQPTVWIDHVELAWRLLRPGGRLAAIVPAGFVYRGDARHERMRDLALHFGGSAHLAPDAFASSGTPVNAMIIWAVRL